MTIRNLTETDYPQMLELFRALDQLHVDARPDFFIHREDVYPQEHYNAAVSDPECLLLGAFDAQEKMLGVVRATLWSESGMVKGLKTVCLDNIYVVPEQRRSGIASKLFEKTEQWAREQGAVRLNLQVWDFNKDALALYQALGMSPRNYTLEKKL